MIRDPATLTPALVFERVETDPSVDFRVLFKRFAPSDVKFYLREVLKAVDYSNSRGIMHRDLKPHNVMMDIHSSAIKVIDWGLAEYYLPSTHYNVRVASRYFKSPELMIPYNYYDYSLDMWSVGCMMAGIIFHKEPFFKGEDNWD